MNFASNSPHMQAYLAGIQAAMQGQAPFLPFMNQNTGPTSANMLNAQDQQNISVQPPAQQVQQFNGPSIYAGRFVNNADEVKPNEVPMDGSITMFPKADLSCVYLKSWNKTGTIDTVCYIPEPQEQIVQQQSAGSTEEPAKYFVDFQNNIGAAFSTLFNRLDEIEARIGTPPTSSRKSKSTKEDTSNADA